MRKDSSPNLSRKSEAGFPLVEMKGIVKRFPGVVANDHIDFELNAGEVHCLLGENGAGKTTLMNILYGLYQPDEGEIRIRGNKVSIDSPLKAIRLGIGMVHQHFKLVDSFTVTENVILGCEKAGSFRLKIRDAEERIRKLSESYGIEVDPRAKIWQLSVGEKQRVEILKMLYRGVDILILDEPTSTLTPKEVDDLATIIKRMVEKGRSVIFITHKLREVMMIADRITILRSGRVVSTLEKSEVKVDDLARMMVGGEFSSNVNKTNAKMGKTVVKVENLKALNDRGMLALKGVSFSVKQGEIFGIAGVAGNGQRELVEAIMGLRKVIDGKIFIEGKDLTNHSTKEIIKNGVGYIPEERTTRGVAMDLTISENAVLGLHHAPSFLDKWFLPFEKAKFFLNYQSINQYTEKLISEFNIKTPSKETLARNLSGGNIQRLILARVLSQKPSILICVQPTRGLDIKATEFVHSKLLEQRKRGSAIILVSMDLDEILSLSDRIAVMYNGEVMGIVSAEKTTPEEIGLMMLGQKIKKSRSK